MDRQLSKEMALVTGSTTGFGQAIAASLAREGASVTGGRRGDPMRGKPCRSGQGQERGRQSRPGIRF
jgi:NAD(P)-dependent dehydrogenase (short-subunit alcohol dehydrogenase family)